MVLPFAFFTKNGYGSYSLTGLLIPDGITFFDLVNSCLEVGTAKGRLVIIIIYMKAVWSYGIFEPKAIKIFVAGQK